MRSSLPPPRPRLPDAPPPPPPSIPLQQACLLSIPLPPSTSCPPPRPLPSAGSALPRGGGGLTEDQGTWASFTRKRNEADCGRPEDGGVWTEQTVKRPPQQPAQPQYANYWASLAHKRHTLPHPAQPQRTNHWAPRTRKRHQQEHRPTESSALTQHAKGRTGDCPGPRKEAITRRNVTQGVPALFGKWVPPSARPPFPS